MSVYRLYVEKKPGLRLEAESLKNEIWGLNLAPGLSELRLLNRYDVEGLSPALWERSRFQVLAEPQTDLVYDELPQGDHQILAVEFLPGQFDQRADSAAQCIQLISQEELPLVRSAKVYLLYGQVDAAQLEAIAAYLINPVESRRASLTLPATLRMSLSQPEPTPRLRDFCRRALEEPQGLIEEYGLAMDGADLACCAQYFLSEGREPSLTELKVLDTYWSDHCRHTTFGTQLDRVEIEDEEVAAAWRQYLALREELGDTRPLCLMDLATIATKAHKKQGLLPHLDESPEINACTVKVNIPVDDRVEPWLLLFKNETHNHPTEIEPFGGAATCLGGAIRDPLSGRAFVYQAMRLTGSADPRQSLADTLPGKLPQRKITTAAAAGYSSYGNQIGLPTGLVDEIYHPGYAAKRMEVGAVIGAAPASHVQREVPQPGDVVLLVGGPTGRDGCGGATGSSKAHDIHSIETCGAEVQKGNAPEERKLQRLFRHGEAARLIRRCNDFGAGGVSVAIGELADGLDINLDAAPLKYAGLTGTEIAISESQERMAVVVAATDVARFQELAAKENLTAVEIAQVTESPRLVMRWQGDTIVDLSRDFLNSNGGERHTSATVKRGSLPASPVPRDAVQAWLDLAGDLNVCDKRGLVERFDSSVGAATVFQPLGGRYQLTPIQAMCAKLPLEKGETSACSLMSWGFDPYLSSASPYHGSYLAVISSVAKLLASGAPLAPCWLSFQEYFPKPGADPCRWGLPLAALLGAFQAQLDLGLSAIGGKDSMSGSFAHLDVPPTLISFAVSLSDGERVISPEFKQAGSRLAYLAPSLTESGLPEAESLRRVFADMARLTAGGRARAARVPERGGIAAALMKMGFGNMIGCELEPEVDNELLFAEGRIGFLLEVDPEEQIGRTLGRTLEEPIIRRGGEEIALSRLLDISASALAAIFPHDYAAGPPAQPEIELPPFMPATRVQPRRPVARPVFLIPAFPGTNSEYDTARAAEAAGGESRIFIIRNNSPAAVAESVREFARAIDESQAIVIPGGFSGGDEPDGSGKFIAAFFRNPQIMEAVERLLTDRDGLMAGICNGFQALVKLGLLPGGHISQPNGDSPTLTFNALGRHQARLARTRIASTLSPWFSRTEPGAIHMMPISHGEGRFLCTESELRALAAAGQISAVYVGDEEQLGADIRSNPNGSLLAVEALCSPDGRVLGKMGHMERITPHTWKNVPGPLGLDFFGGAMDYFK